MRNILDELYDLDLFHLTEIEDTDGVYKSAMDRLVNAETELLKTFPDCKAILDEYQSADIDLAQPFKPQRVPQGLQGWRTACP